MISIKQAIRRLYTATSIVLLTPKRISHTHQQQLSLPTSTMSGSCHQQPSSSSSTLSSSVSEQAVAAFSNNPSMVSQYIEQTPRKVPGYHALQSMTQILLEESIDSPSSSAPATILVVGAGGGMEMSQFGTAHPNDWSLVGIDPSFDMLELARQMTRSLSNVTYYQGYVTDPDVPQGPYDGATCLLTLHFLPKSQRLDTLRTIYNLLKPGAPLIVAHHSMETRNVENQDQTHPDEPTQQLSSSTSTSSMVSINPWLQRYAAYTAAHSVNGAMSLEEALRGAQTIQERLPYLSPQQDEELLQQAGFHNIQQFYMAFTFRGWVAYKPSQKD